MFTSIRTIATVMLFGISLSFISTAVLVDEASAERKGFTNRTYDW